MYLIYVICLKKHGPELRCALQGHLDIVRLIIKNWFASVIVVLNWMGLITFQTKVLEKTLCFKLYMSINVACLLWNDWRAYFTTDLKKQYLY